MTRQKNIRAHYRETDTGSSRMLVCAIKSLCTTMIASCLLIFLVASVACSMDDPVGVVDACAWICLGVASLIGGIAAALICKENSTAAAMVSGGMFVLLLLTFAFAFDSINSPLYMMVGYAISLLLHYLGARIAQGIGNGRRRGGRRGHR